MIQFDFYKRRDFGSYISDSFSFMKMYFGNFLKNALIICGAIIFVTTSIGTFIIYENNYQNSFFSTLLLRSNVLIIVLVILFLIALLFVFLYPITYFKISENYPERNNFSASEILSYSGKIFKRILLFFIFYLFTLFPLTILISFLFTSITKNVGLLLSIPTYVIYIFFNLFFTILSFQSGILFVKDNEKFFKSLTKSFTLLKSNFLQKMGATFVMGIITYMLSIFGILISVSLITLGIVGIETEIVTIILSFFSLFLSFVFVFLIVPLLTLSSQMMIYYSDKYQEKIFSEIDKIGNNN